VLVRSTTDSGRIILKAKSAGLKGASVTIKSSLVRVAGGMSAALPGEGLPSYLERGPTPAGQSFMATRTAVPIARATAGSNAGSASASFDDDETTSWANDNKLATAWIEYEFARPARPMEVVLKLIGWRQRSYPLRISVEGREVFHGITPRSLGYVILPLQPAAGRNLKIELADAAEARDGFNITELENPQNAATGDERAGGGTLGIVEFECYEK
jgi:hypothetical protein